MQVDDAARVALPRLVKRLVVEALVGGDDLLEDLAADAVQLGRGGEPDARAGDGDVDVEVGDGALGEPVGVLLNPLDGADQAVLLGVPGGEDAVDLALA
jgi:hypothetical protein